MIWVGLDAPYNDHVKAVNRLGHQLGVTACSVYSEVHEKRYCKLKILGSKSYSNSQKISSWTTL